MVSIEKITYKFGQLDEFLSLLKQIKATPLKRFTVDKILIGSAKYYLQVSIECCLDIASHIIATERYRPPKDYADAFKVLEEQEIISHAHGKRLRQMAKFRNRLVHMYGEIDDTQIYAFIDKDLKDIESFRLTILNKYT